MQPLSEDKPSEMLINAVMSYTTHCSVLCWEIARLRQEVETQRKRADAADTRYHEQKDKNAMLVSVYEENLSMLRCEMQTLRSQVLAREAEGLPIIGQSSKP